MKRSYCEFISNMSGYSAKHDKLLNLAKLSFEEISALAETGDGDELVTCVERVSTLVKRLEDSIEKTKEAMLDGDVLLEEIVNWSKLQTPKLKYFQEMRSKLKQAGNDKQRDEEDRKFRDEMEKERVTNEEAMRAKLHEQQEIDAIAKRKIQREKEWLLRQKQMGKVAKEQISEVSSDIMKNVQLVKLQRYTITVEQKKALLPLHRFSDASKKAVCAAVYEVGIY